MLVRILKPIAYEPHPGEPRRTFGQLLCRPRTDGVKSGRMEHFYPKGRTPDVREDVAREWIAQGIAEPFTMDAVATGDAWQMLAELKDLANRGA